MRPYNKWIEEGYRFFAEQGPENLTIKALARQCGLPRTNFYYHFSSKEEFIDRLITRHLTLVENVYVVELQKRVRNYNPDIFYVLSDFEQDHMFARQLFKNRDVKKYNDAYKKGVALSADTLIPKFKSFFKIELSDEKVRVMWYTLVDAWYSRLNPDNFSLESQGILSQEIIDTVLPFAKKIQ